MVVIEEKWPVLGRHERAVEWLRIWTELGRVPRTIDAYARGLAEYLQVCEEQRDGNGRKGLRRVLLEPGVVQHRRRGGSCDSAEQPHSQDHDCAGGHSMRPSCQAARAIRAANARGSTR
jgi:hypothetical protein